MCPSVVSGLKTHGIFDPWRIHTLAFNHSRGCQKILQYKQVLLSFLQNLRNIGDKNRIAGVVFMDLSKAFDSMNQGPYNMGNGGPWPPLFQKIIFFVYRIYT